MASLIPSNGSLRTSAEGVNNTSPAPASAALPATEQSVDKAKIILATQSQSSQSKEIQLSKLQKELASINAQIMQHVEHPSSESEMMLRTLFAQQEEINGELEIANVASPIISQSPGSVIPPKVEVSAALTLSPPADVESQIKTLDTQYKKLNSEFMKAPAARRQEIKAEREVIQNQIKELRVQLPVQAAQPSAVRSPISSIVLPSTNTAAASAAVSLPQTTPVKGPLLDPHRMLTQKERTELALLRDAFENKMKENVANFKSSGDVSHLNALIQQFQDNGQAVNMGSKNAVAVQQSCRGLLERSGINLPDTQKFQLMSAMSTFRNRDYIDPQPDLSVKGQMYVTSIHESKSAFLSRVLLLAQIHGPEIREIKNREGEESLKPRKERDLDYVRPSGKSVTPAQEKMIEKLNGEVAEHKQMLLAKFRGVDSPDKREVLQRTSFLMGDVSDEVQGLYSEGVVQAILNATTKEIEALARN